MHVKYGELRARARQRFVYSGRALLVTNLGGTITGQECEGFYFENTRLLSRFELTADDRPLSPIVAGPVCSAGLLAYASVPAARREREGTLFAQLACFLGDGGLRVEVRIANYARRDSARLTLGIHLAADFADIMEIEEECRRQSGPVETRWDEARRELMFRYGHPNLDRALVARVECAPGDLRVDEDSFTTAMEIAPHTDALICLLFEPVFNGVRYPAPPALFDESSTELGRVRQRLREEMPTLVTTNATVARAWQTATDDLAGYPLGLPDGPSAPIAGLPLYQQFFGRDTLTIAWQALMASQTLMRDSLLANADALGSGVDDLVDEEPGKLIHQADNGPLAALKLTPYARYYGDYATPSDFLIMLGQYLSWTGDVATVRALLPAARRVVAWCERYGDLDGDGFLEYVTRSGQGIKNQGWKDAEDAIVDEDGEIVANPIATSEVQAYYYAGLQQAALAFFVAGDRAYALQLLGKARALKRRFDRAFWMEDERFYALALGPDKRQVRSIASNAGHLLAAGIVPRAKGPLVARRLLQQDLYSGWGVRTLSSAHPAYNPFSYHLGSVWPVEQGTFALGLARYGCVEELHRLAEGFFAATELFVSNRLPEVLGGFTRDWLHPQPGLYPRSNQPQGWSSSAVVLVVQALLGVLPLAPLGVAIVEPHLPPWLPSLRIEGIRVGGALLDLDAWRTARGATRHRASVRQGRLHVVRQPPPEAPQTTPWGWTIASLARLAGY